MPSIPDLNPRTPHDELIDQIRQGNHAAFEALFHCYYEPLCRFIDRYVNSLETARDLAEDVFVRLWTRRATLCIRGSVAGYLYGAARLEAIDYARHAEVRLRLARQHIPDSVPGMAMPGRSDEEVLHLAELRAALRAAIASLPPRSGMIVTLRWEHELSYAEIAEALDISPKTVENQMSIAFRYLRSALAPFGP